MIKEILNKNQNIKSNTYELEKLKQAVPQCFNKDGSFNMDIFKSLLESKIDIKNEGYSLNFLGKNYARLLAGLDTDTVITLNKEHNNKPENLNSENIYITGDNLDGLKHLLKSYRRKIKCIYIDPPYNTGTDGFVYNDKFNFTVENLMERLSIDEDEAIRILEFTKKKSASHSAWLMFIYPRLLLARDLLTEDGVIFISIDDNEQADLKLLCDEIFGEENKLGIVSNINNPKGRSDDKFVATAHEYILIYARSNNVIWYGFKPTKEIMKRYNKIDNNGDFYREIDLRKTGENDLREDRPNLFYYFYLNEKDKTFYPSKDNYEKEGYIRIKPQREDGREGNWRWSINTVKERINEIYPKFMPNRKIWGIMQKDYIKERSLIKPTSAWSFKDINSERGTEEFLDLKFDKRIFPKPKPVGTIARCIQLSTKYNDIILDFFSGSSTTAQAVMELNLEDNGNRKYIMIQLDENVKKNSEAEKAGYTTIDEIGRERIIRAAAKIKQENPDTTADLGFKHYILNDVPTQVIDELEEFDPNKIALFDEENTVLHKFGTDTVLTTWLVSDGYGLNANVKTVDLDGYTAYYCQNHLYLIYDNFNENAMKALIEKYDEDGSFNPENIILFGYSFNWSQSQMLKDNLFKLKITERNITINIDMRY